RKENLEETARVHPERASDAMRPIRLDEGVVDGIARELRLAKPTQERVERLLGEARIDGRRPRRAPDWKKAPPKLGVEDERDDSGHESERRAEETTRGLVERGRRHERRPGEQWNPHDRALFGEQAERQPEEHAERHQREP